MHIPQVWCDGESSFCIVPNSGIWGPSAHKTCGLSNAYFGERKTANRSSHYSNLFQLDRCQKGKERGDDSRRSHLMPSEHKTISLLLLCSRRSQPSTSWMANGFWVLFFYHAGPTTSDACCPRCNTWGALLILAMGPLFFFMALLPSRGRCRGMTLGTHRIRHGMHHRRWSSP